MDEKQIANLISFVANCINTSRYDFEWLDNFDISDELKDHIINVILP